MNILNNILLVVVVTSMFLVVYHHLAYPIILKVARYFRGSPSLPEYRPLSYGLENTATPDMLQKYPHITIVMPAFNEAEHIAEKVRNLACLDYPNHRFNVVIACDGCTDNTGEIAASVLDEIICADLQCSIVSFSKNRGKIAVLNEVVPSCTGDLVALTDVSSLLSFDALEVVATRFQDKSVGAVNGNYRLMKAGSEGEKAYWAYQSAIKIGEEALGSVMGAHGACYFFRRRLFEKLPDNTINDDFIIPMRMVEQGYRVVYEPRLNALELECADVQQDWLRRIRISTGNVQQLICLLNILHPRFGGIAFSFFSGKGLRVLMPVLMIISLVGSYVLGASYAIFAIAALLQTLIYGIAVSAYLRRPEQVGRLSKTIYYIVFGHLAGLFGISRYLHHTRHSRW